VNFKKKSPTTSTKPPEKLKKHLTANFKKNQRATKKHVKKHFHTIVPAAVLLLVVGVLISSKYYTSENMKSEQLFARVFSPNMNISVDEVVSAGVAKIIATDTDMIVAANVSNLASSAAAKVKLNISEQSYVAKPQIVTTDAKTRDDVVNYTIKEGDTVGSVAKKFSITSDTIRWANDISGNSLLVGEKLKILPISGLTYEVKDGDSAESLAKQYESNAEQIISFNDAEVAGLTAGEQIIIPNGKKPAPAPAQYFSSAPSFFGSAGSVSAPYAFTGKIFPGNTYAWGNCTWWVYQRRAELGRPIPSNLGNANMWAINGAAAGMSVSKTPVAGSIIYHINDPASFLGHVGIVERVNPDGSIFTSDMNYNFLLNKLVNRNIPTSEFYKYLFIN